MKYKVFLLFFLLGLFLGMNAYATPLMVKDGTQTLTINGTDYTITDKVGDFTSYNATIGGYEGSTWTGYYIGTIIGNDEKNQYAALKDLLPYFCDLPYVISADSVEMGSVDGDINVSSSDGWKTGEWDLDDQAPGYVSFYTVKGSTEFALYYLDPAADNGKWTTEHLMVKNKTKSPALSHLSVVYTNPVPEPATLLLLGAGLIGLTSFRKKRKS